jgi:hypothetical protein
MINPDERLGAAGNFTSNVDAKVALSGTTAKTGALAAGVYVATTDVDCFFKIGPVASITATTSAIPLWANTYRHIEIKAGANDAVAAITAGGTGNLHVFSTDQ